MFIPIILGTGRKARHSKKVAKFMLQEILKNGLESEIIDVRDFRVEATDNTKKSPQAKKLSQKISQADGLIIVSPEYNHGYPGELKIMLDLLYEEYARKPVGFCGVSLGPLGGARVVEQLRLVSVEFHMVPIREAIYFPMVDSLFDNGGLVKEKIVFYLERIKKFLDELLWYANALKVAREKGGDKNESR